MSQPEHDSTYDPTQVLGHVLSLMPPSAGASPKTWDLLEWLAQSQGLGDVNAMMNIHRSSNLDPKSIYSMLNVVARLEVGPQTAPRRARLIEDLLAAGANPWAGDLADGIAVIKATRGSPALAAATSHPSFPGWRALAPEHGFRSLIQSLDLPALLELLDEGLPVGLSAGRFVSSPWASLLDLCSDPAACNELVRRGAPLGTTLVKRIASGEMRAVPAVMELAVLGQGTPSGDAIAAAVLASGLKAKHLNQVKVGVVLCGPKAIEIVAGTDDTIARANGLAAIASAASRNALALDDKALAEVAEIIQSLAMECTDMKKLRGKPGMAWLGSALEDLATRVVSGETTVGSKSITTLAGLMSGIVPASWRLQWLPDQDPLDRADRLLIHCPINPVENMSKDTLSYWHRCLGERFNGVAPLSFFKGSPGRIASWGGNLAKWLQCTALTMQHIKSGGPITDMDFVRNIEEVAAQVGPKSSYHPSIRESVNESAKAIRAHYDHGLMQSATPASPPPRPAPRM